MNEYLTFLQVERVTQINSTCLLAYMDAGLLPYKLQEGIRLIRRSQAKRLVTLHEQLTREFVDYLYEQQIDLAIIYQAVSDREGQLYFRWISFKKQLSETEISG